MRKSYPKHGDILLVRHGLPWKLAEYMVWFHGQYIHEPGEITKPDGKPYTVFTFTPNALRLWVCLQDR